MGREDNDIKENDTKCYYRLLGMGQVNQDSTKYIETIITTKRETGIDVNLTSQP